MHAVNSQHSVNEEMHAVNTKCGNLLVKIIILPDLHIWRCNLLLYMLIIGQVELW